MPKLCKRTAPMHADANARHCLTFHGTAEVMGSDHHAGGFATATGGIVTAPASDRKIKNHRMAGNADVPGGRNAMTWHTGGIA